MTFSFRVVLLGIYKLLLMVILLKHSGGNKQNACNGAVKGDVFLMVDISQNMAKTQIGVNHFIQFLKALIRSLPVGQNAVRIGLIYYHGKSRMAANLTANLTKLLREINGMESDKDSASSNVFSALKTLSTKGLSRTSGERPKIGLIVSNAWADVDRIDRPAVTQLKERGVKLVYAGDKVTDEVMSEIVSKPIKENMFYLHQYSFEARNKASVIASKMCDLLNMLRSLDPRKAFTQRPHPIAPVSTKATRISSTDAPVPSAESTAEISPISLSSKATATKYGSKVSSVTQANSIQQVPKSSSTTTTLPKSSSTKTTTPLPFPPSDLSANASLDKSENAHNDGSKASVTPANSPQQVPKSSSTKTPKSSSTTPKLSTTPKPSSTKMTTLAPSPSSDPAANVSRDKSLETAHNDGSKSSVTPTNSQQQVPKPLSTKMTTPAPFPPSGFAANASLDKSSEDAQNDGLKVPVTPTNSPVPKSSSTKLRTPVSSPASDPAANASLEKPSEDTQNSSSTDEGTISSGQSPDMPDPDIASNPLTKTEKPRGSQDTPSRHSSSDATSQPEEKTGKATLLKAKNQMGFLPNTTGVFEGRPKAFKAFFEYSDVLMACSRGNLTRADKEMIAIATSAVNKCLYCVAHHSAMHRKYSNDTTLADQIATDWKRANLNSRQKAMLRFAMGVNNAKTIREEDFKELKRHGLSQEDAWSIAAIAAFQAMISRLAHVANVRPNKEFYFMGRMMKCDHSRQDPDGS